MARTPKGHPAVAPCVQHGSGVFILAEAPITVGLLPDVGAPHRGDRLSWVKTAWVLLKILWRCRNNSRMRFRSKVPSKVLLSPDLIFLSLGPSLRMSFRTEAVTLETKNGQSVVRGVPCISSA